MRRLAVIGLGGNLGNPQDSIQKAIAKLVHAVGELDECSSFYRTAAWGVENQPDFINSVVGFHTTCSPTEILASCLRIENEIGRIRDGVKKWSERLIDIDLLYCGEVQHESGDLVLPHPYIQERNFVLIPLTEVYPELRHPTLKKTSKELLAESTDKGTVEKIDDLTGYIRK